jgi:hypothetical protein
MVEIQNTPSVLLMDCLAWLSMLWNIKGIMTMEAEQWRR